MTENREINVGGITIDIPGDLIDVEDFVQTTLRIAPKALHIVDDVVVKMNWAAGDLKRVGARLRTYQAVIQIAAKAGCKAEAKLAYALAQMYLNPDLWKEVECTITFEVAMLTDMATVLNNQEEVHASVEQDWIDLGLDRREEKRPNIPPCKEILTSKGWENSVTKKGLTRVFVDQDDLIANCEVQIDLLLA